MCIEKSPTQCKTNEQKSKSDLNTHFQAFNEAVSMDSLQNSYIIASESSDISVNIGRFIFVKDHIQTCTSNVQTTFQNINKSLIRDLQVSEIFLVYLKQFFKKLAKKCIKSIL